MLQASRSIQYSRNAGMVSVGRSSKDSARAGCHFNGPKGLAMGGEWLLEMPLPSLSTEVVPGKLREEEGVSLMKTTESLAQAIKTCWQKEMEKKTNTGWAGNFICSHITSRPVQKGPHFMDLKRGIHLLHLLLQQSWDGRARSLPLPLGIVKAKVGQLPPTC